ncbi:type 4b pilus protein PilO2 (plasmid) [Dyella sp. BiH032]|uniref:type 4b pilus protein PilO2 n=1 Tax=Dyella sp. BiH032 TaxID=3075430 RepID=UPI0028936316|nr:type 4b pilus protein PilO2 [Dyella sp. BiH032]WNL48555.1 type 4b pilus protein PilO2 [Dyella sp. BiH032]
MTARKSRVVDTGPKLADSLPIVVVQINGKQFVSGLYWHVLTKPQSYVQEAQANGHKLGMDVVAFRKGAGNSRQIQAGFAPKRNGAFKGTYSWAAAIAGTLGDDCLAGFKLGEDQYGIVGVLGGIIVPGSDRVLSRDQFTKHFRATEQKIAGTDKRWRRIIAPAEFGVASEELDVTAVLTPKALKKEYQLKSLSRFDFNKDEIKRWTVIGLAVVVILGGGRFGWSKYQAIQQKKKDDIAHAQWLLDESKRAKERAEFEKNNVVPHAWTGQLSPAALAKACMPGMLSTPISGAGWKLTGVGCNTDASTPGVGHIRFSYSRPTGSISTFVDFQAWALRTFHAKAEAQDKAFNTAAIGLAFKVDGSDDDAAPSLEDGMSTIVSYMQQRGLSVEPAPMPPFKPQPDDPNPPRQEWSGYTFTVATGDRHKLSIESVPLATTRLTAIEAALDEKAHITWTYTGAFYVK